MAFKSEKELLGIFYTEGSFYQIDLNGTGYKCRGLAKINRRGIVTNAADALFVLVNPGSCKPEDENYQFPSYHKKLTKIPSVPARSDATQLQIMRLMERRKWNMIYIINLSDLRAGNFNEFKTFLTEFRKSSNDSHSIFSSDREGAIQSLLSDETVIIAGWGKNPVIKKEASHVLSFLSKIRTVKGLPYPIVPYYRHPFPMLKTRCIEWLDDIMVVLDEDKCDE